MMTKTYLELIELPTFEERFEYLKLGGRIGDETFGWRRGVNQTLYHSPEWRRFRNEVIIRDNGCDLGVEGFEIREPIIIHHINPITYEDILNRAACVFDLNNVICVRDATHKAIHYCNEAMLPQMPVARRQNDTCPWKK